ncbi:MAG TPA: metallophosphoesterase family protein [Candidatus Dormibacteraeota bacterium]
MTTRIGVVADTHCPEFLERLPDRVFEVLRGVDLIIHAGDVNRRETIAALAAIAPVEAVRGDHDGVLSELPLSRLVTVEGRRIVVVHGNRSRWIEEPQTLLWTLSLGAYHPHAGLPSSLRRRFAGSDAIVFGHTHRAHVETLDGTLMFNPGAVHQWNPRTAALRLKQDPGWFEWSWLQVARHMRNYQPPTVGILEVSRSAIVPTVIPLESGSPASLRG